MSLARRPSVSGGSAASPVPHVRTRSILVIAVAFALLVAWVLASWVMLPPRGACTPLAAATSPSLPMAFTVVFDHWNASVRIIAATVCESPSHYRFVLAFGSARGDRQPLPAAGSWTSTVVNGTAFRVGWTDATANGLVDVGDSIQVTGEGAHLPAAPGPDSNFVFNLTFYSTGEEWLGHVSWQMPFLQPSPTVTFGGPILVGGNATLPIQRVSVAYDPAYYWLNLAVGTGAGVPTEMPAVSGPPGSREFVNGVQYNLPWIDRDGSGTLSSGDWILVNGDEVALPAASSFTFFLLWTDGSPVSTVSWTT